MKSKWFELKDKAVSLRKKGRSIRYVERALCIPRSTLSGWFKSVKLSKKQKKILYKNWKSALDQAREKAIIWHNSKKEGRLLEAKRQASEVLNRLNADDKDILDIALAALYLGEGFKKNTETGLPRCV